MSNFFVKIFKSFADILANPVKRSILLISILALTAMIEFFY